MRITPAYAGKSVFRGADEHAREDHPRIRGEKIALRRNEWRSWGSPPHTRGKGRFSVLKLRCPRITPAYAGKRIGTLG